MSKKKKKNSPFIQVGNSFFKVIKTDDKVELLPIKAEEAISEEMEKIVLSPQEDEINVSIFQEIIDNARSELKTSLERNLKATVLTSLGFEKDTWGGGFRVDHCNGRMSAVTELISKEIREKLLEAELGKDFDLTKAEKESLRKEMTKEFKRAYKDKVQDLVWKGAEDLATSHVQDFVLELCKEKLKVVAETMLEKTIKNTT